MDKQFTPQRVIDRLLSKITVDPETGCWVSHYAPQPNGYAQVGFMEGRQTHHRLVHRASWVHFKGRIPDGWTVDHLCRVRLCINPDHLRILPKRIHCSDNGQSFKTHCPQGHPYSGDNLRINARGARECRPCCNAAARRARAKRKRETN